MMSKHECPKCGCKFSEATLSERVEVGEPNIGKPIPVGEASIPWNAVPMTSGPVMFPFQDFGKVTKGVVKLELSGDIDPTDWASDDAIKAVALVSRMQCDARRYRWLCQQQDVTWQNHNGQWGGGCDGNSLDIAIDAAIKSARP